jgi:hypothetical protein
MLCRLPCRIVDDDRQPLAHGSPAGDRVRAAGVLHHAARGVGLMIGDWVPRVDLEKVIAERDLAREEVIFLGSKVTDQERSEYFVIRKRDDAPIEVYPFRCLADAQEFYEKAALQWSEVFVCRVLSGPAILF